VEHRVVVDDGELAHPGATYLYEGVYYVADDDSLYNNIGWRETTMAWTGTVWDFDDVNPLQLAPNPGPVVATWGDLTSSGAVAADDGEVWLSVQVTDLGGGSWHYEYALYNRTSARGIHSFSVPVGPAVLSNVGLRDLDTDAGNDWTVTQAGGQITWATDDHATDPDAPALEYQSMFNFRFDADVDAVSASAALAIFAPGIGTSVSLGTLAPAAGAVAVATLPAGRAALRIDAVEPNPFADGTRVRFSVPAEASARLTVVDVSGRTVRTLVDAALPAGPSQVAWDGRDADGRTVASGVYFVRLESGDAVRTVKTTRLR
jgi:hypothetical protein